MFRIEKLKKEEGSRMRSENKELEYSLEKLRLQRVEAENKLQLMVSDLLYVVEILVVDFTFTLSQGFIIID